MNYEDYYQSNVNVSPWENSNYVSNLNSHDSLQNDYPKTSKVYVNPNFHRNVGQTKTIHINPRIAMICDSYHMQNKSSQANCNNVPRNTKIHINPKMANIKLPQNVHINPNFKCVVPSPNISNAFDNVNKSEEESLSLSTKTSSFKNNELVPVAEQSKVIKRRNSVKSKFKIVKSNCQSPYKHIKDNSSKYKVDHRRRKSITIELKNEKKYIKMNVKRTTKSNPIRLSQKHLSLVKINGIMYKKSPNSLRTLNTPVKKKSIWNKKEKYELLKKSDPRIEQKDVKTDNKTTCQPIRKSQLDTISRFKVDHRKRKSIDIEPRDRRKYIFKNKLLCLTDLLKGSIVKKTPSKTSQKSLSIVRINNVMYKKSKNSLRRAYVSSTPTKKVSPEITKSKYKLVKRSKDVESVNRNIIKIRKMLSPLKIGSVKLFSKKLKICNIPCPYYRKYGVCRGKENGKCFRKHDPDQIALCTKFLQGACIKEKCLLSHKVSPEKMPTCKFFLEGSCIKETCSYLHVKLNKNADICRDFLEGFCRKAAECDRRHQYLCPEYEKHGKCTKQRCPYPHGKMVRSYLIHKSKFAKNYSDKNKVDQTEQRKVVNEKLDKIDERLRYYKNDKAEYEIEQENGSKNLELLARPKLGSLPAFIPFTE
ncbi:zinc finger CCCH domain-containing protein 3 [Sitophilus oryzae]|uniref:Zinc finger CCCH domain-containing protein 3 n=1 Tax=Sitophilus oryzae TaxID=7048 RepID=A0A6J2XGK9_SITOR|nr:zinc finger CCCH domain-containing protein 3 [Sitophilus oryzae]